MSTNALISPNHCHPDRNFSFLLGKRSGAEGPCVSEAIVFLKKSKCSHKHLR